MSKSDFLLEIGLEEIPARFILDASKQLSQKLEELLQKQNIAYGEVKSYSTPRRLAVFIKDVANKQADIHEEVKGPAKKLLSMRTAIGRKQLLVLQKGKGKQWMIFILKKLAVLNMFLLKSIFMVKIQSIV